LKHKNTQPIYIFNRENPQNSEPQNGPRRGLDFIALADCTCAMHKVGYQSIAATWQDNAIGNQSHTIPTKDTTIKICDDRRLVVTA
jgi:hypothetical protein